MIGSSVMLILVAVVLLVLGLASGSSALLIISIAASLLAAVTLVVGARRAASIRLAAENNGERAGRYDDGFPGPDDASAPPEPRWDRGTGGPAARRAPWAGAADPGSVALADPVEAPAADPDGEDPTEEQPVVREPGTGADLDGSVRDTDPPRRDRTPAEPLEPVAQPPGPRYRARQHPAAPDDLPGSQQDDLPGSQQDDLRASQQPAAAVEPAEDEDPPDEPAPQPMSAVDAARVAGLDTDVLVIDGRPRYHLAGCAVLDDRPGEALPVSEAVELGFSPCGRCSPASRLLAGAYPG